MTLSVTVSIPHPDPILQLLARRLANLLRSRADDEPPEVAAVLYSIADDFETGGREDLGIPGSVTGNPDRAAVRLTRDPDQPPRC